MMVRGAVIGHVTENIFAQGIKKLLGKMHRKGGRLCKKKKVMSFGFVINKQKKR